MSDVANTSTPFARAGLNSGLYFMDQLRREAKSVADVDLTTGGSYTIRSTVNPALQRAVETALQDGLVRYEMNYGRARFQGPETNLAKTVQRLEASSNKMPVSPSRMASVTPPVRTAIDGTPEAAAST